MSSPEESPAQRSARLRRERREAKIKEGGSARLDKITNLGGRPSASLREESSPSPQPSSRSPSMQSSMQQTSPQPPTPPNDTQSQEALQAQQEYIRAILRQSGPPPEQQGMEEDPTMKLLGSLLGTAPPPGNPNGGGAGAGPGAEGQGGPQLSPADIASSLGVPPWAANMLGAATNQQSEAEKKQVQIWKLLHVIFSIAIAVYLLFLFGASVTTYGSQPPPPATAQSPFVIFVTGELVLSGTRLLMRNKAGGAGLGLYVQLFRDVIRDGSVVLFLLGMATWWNRGWMQVV